MGPSSVSADGLEGVVVAVLVIVGTVFLGRRASTGRRRVPRRSLDLREPDLGNPSLNGEESSNLDHEETEQSHSRADVRVPDIFLSHSGHQKGFVEFLYQALQSANHTAFLDQLVLPMAEPFPDNIKEAAMGCKVGVVVLSEEFLTYSWPMIELEILILQRGSKPCVLPLFYELSPADLKSEAKLQKWRRSWKKMARGEDGAKRWEQAVKALSRIKGVVYTRGTSTYTYINRVVKHIGTLIPCHTPYDCSSIQGQSRLEQKIAAEFDHVDERRARTVVPQGVGGLGETLACIVGLHGVGGLGKTALCKVMVNYYRNHYSGRSFLIGFPSHGADKSLITSECKKALRILTDASEVHLLDTVDQFDQVIQLMRDCVGRRDVFLAIDNLWECSLDEAKRVLQVGFSAKSKILVTSRSEGLLKELLMNTHESPAINASVAPLPTPECKEAFQIFQKSFELCELHVLINMKGMNNVLNKCCFNGSYHALALKALAKYVKRVCWDCDQEEVKHRLIGVLEEISYEDLAEVEDVLRLSYDHLPEEKKNLFLDIVVFVCLYDGKMYADVEKWISYFHWKFPWKTLGLIRGLSLDGLIQTEVDKFGRNVMGFHALYKELALREVANSPRYLLQAGKINMKISEKVQWEKLEMMILCLSESPRLEKLQQYKCPKLQLFKVASRVMESSEVCLDSMPSLTVLKLSCIKLVENKDGCNMPEPLLLEIGRKGPDQEGPVKSPRSGFVRGESVVASSILRLNRLVELRELKVGSCDFVEIAGLRSLVRLRVLNIRCCQNLKKLPDLSNLTRLEELRLISIPEMEEVGSLSCTLKDVHVHECVALKRMPDTRSLTCLEKLELTKNAALEEVGGLSCTLKDVSVKTCGNLKRMPDMRRLTCLERLELFDNEALEEVGGLSCTLKDVSVQECRALKRMPDMSSLTCLERLNLLRNAALQEVEGERLSSTLKDLCICECGMLGSCPSVDESMQLEMLHMGWEHCLSVLQKVPNLRTCLRRWHTGYSSTMKEIDVGCFTNLEYLDVHCCKALEEIRGIIALPILKELQLRLCPRLKKLSVGGPSLKKLCVSGCEALEEIGGDLEALPSLEHLLLADCENLKELGAVSSLQLQSLTLSNCPSLQDSSIPEAKFRY